MPRLRHDPPSSGGPQGIDRPHRRRNYPQPAPARGPQRSGIESPEHRDFKAANAIVTHTGRLKIVDFGLARRRDPAMAEATTAASLAPIGALVGTPYAMAPEQVRGEAADARSDIWAFGVLLHEMVSGTKPFEAATMPELFSSILRDAPRPVPVSVPAGLRAVIERCLEKAPERRYQLASDVRTSLEAIQASTSDANSMPTSF